MGSIINAAAASIVGCSIAAASAVIGLIKFSGENVPNTSVVANTALILFMFFIFLLSPQSV